ADYARPELFRYVLSGSPSTSSEGASVHEQIKDAYDRPYLPGSSLKGALRTVLFWGLGTEVWRQLDLHRLELSRSWASRSWERDVFGRNPNYDWLRALQVADSQPLASTEAKLTLRTVRIYHGQERESHVGPVTVETVDPGAAFELDIAVDEYGFQGHAARELGWEGQREWLSRLTEMARGHARERLAREIAFFQPGPAAVFQFYQERQAQLQALGENELVLQLGWGAGWESKTLGSGILGEDAEAFETLIRRYRMTQERGRRPGDPFPTTRALALSASGEPTAPLGWVRIRLEGYTPAQPYAPLEPPPPPREPERREVEGRQPTPPPPPPPLRDTCIGIAQSRVTRHKRKGPNAGTIVVEGRLSAEGITRLNITGEAIPFDRRNLGSGVDEIRAGQRVSFALGPTSSGALRAENVQPYTPGEESA
ncbi:MAG: type III-A CRISPR-associated RAMP protein Csm5, partial [Chloroflexi bacterium]|nr:type III-A CRISPR-associated RAMP protein Csm5 [Chloroflexota bacterium]